jgi:hypothetical protein
MGETNKELQKIETAGIAWLLDDRHKADTLRRRRNTQIIVQEFKAPHYSQF